MRPFHYAFLVTDMAQARAFYGGVLGCREGRSAETWIDYDFYGHQIVCHFSKVAPTSEMSGVVDGIQVPIPHFGVLLEAGAFESLERSLCAAGIEFVVSPRVRFSGTAGEQSTMFFKDPFGNAIEIKSFKNEEGIFTKI